MSDVYDSADDEPPPRDDSNSAAPDERVEGGAAVCDEAEGEKREEKEPDLVRPPLEECAGSSELTSPEAVRS